MAKTYVTLLRAVNVGKTWVPMEELRELFGTLGFQDVRTYIQSGNVVFKTGASRSKCAAAIGKALGERLPTPIQFILKSSDELAAIVAANPFVSEPSIDPAKLHATFLSAAPAKTAWEKLSAIRAGDDRFHACGSEIFLHCPNGYGNTKLSNQTIERALAVPATTRNWKTVNKLLEMALEG